MIRVIRAKDEVAFITSMGVVYPRGKDKCVVHAHGQHFELDYPASGVAEALERNQNGIIELNGMWQDR